MTPNTVLACIVLLILGVSALLACAWYHDRKRRREMWQSHKEFIRRYREFQRS
jgi:hypothetical protein